MMKLKSVLHSTFFLLTGLLFSLSLQASSMGAMNVNQSALPMSQFNFQGYVPESRGESRRNLQEDPQLVRLLIDPSLNWVINQVIDQYKTGHDVPFRIHQGTQQDLERLQGEGEQFDIIIYSELSRAHALLVQKKATEARLLAVGRMGLWAPLESARSLSVLNLQPNGAIGLPGEGSVHNQAAREIMERGNLLPAMEKRLHPANINQDLYQLVRTHELPLAFLPWQRLVEGGVQQQRDVLKLPSSHHSPITYGAALTSAGSQRGHVTEFWSFLTGSASKAIFQSAGFD